MKETDTLASFPPLASPKGIGMAVAFDWGLAVQIFVTPFLTLLLGVPGPFKQLSQNSALSTLLSFVITLPFAALVAIFGEGVRRGWAWTRPIQVSFNTLGFLGGFFTLFSFLQAPKHNNYWPLVTTIILLIFSPLIAWRLSRPETGAWFKHVTSIEARKRHGGMWPVYIALWAAVGGVLQSLATLFR